MLGRAAWTAAPNEVSAPPANVTAYDEWRKSDTLRFPYKVSSALLRGIRTDLLDSVVECPLLVFVNARSGGRQGAELALLLSRAVGRAQVFDIGQKEYRPDKVLGRFYDNLKSLELAGDPRVTGVRQRLRLLVCGGDGTIAWVMGVIKKLKLHPEPAIAIMPLGTGNDLSRSFLWGPAFDRKLIKGRQAMYDTLNRIATAKDDKLDCWNITVTAPRRAMFSNGVPHSLSPPAPPAPAIPPLGVQTPHSRGPGPAHPGYGRGQSSGLNQPSGPGGAGIGGSSTAAALGLHAASGAAAARDPSTAGNTERSVPVSMVATHGSATPLQNIATSSVGSAATTFTTATNMSMHTGAAQAGTSVPPTIVSGAVSTSAEEEAGIGVMGGMFWNYFSVGLDAKSAWGFHSLREARPGCTNSRLANQFWYSFFSCTSGWFCCAQPLNIKVTLEVLREGPAGEAAGWQPVKLPANVKALIVLNLQSYAGGRNLWGPKTTAAATRKHGFKAPSYNDGLLEVVGLQSGWHSGIVMASKGELLHAKRICQAAGVRIAVAAPYVRRDGEPSHCYMQIDGEPWKQDIPVKGQESPVRVEIVHGGVSRLLRNEPRGSRDASSTAPTVASLHLKSSGGQQVNPLISAVADTGGGLASAVPGPSAVPGALSQSQSSIQLSASQALATGAAAGVLGGGPVAVAVAPSAVQTASTSGALQHQVTHGSHSGATPGVMAWTRIGSAGRPSVTSAAGSSSAAGIEPLPVEGPAGAAARGTAGGAPARPGAGADGAADGGNPSSAAASAVLAASAGVGESPTPRTLSTDLGSQGARSAATVAE